ncbi:MAG TPA: SRPBCC domain-containing protein [Nitrososphaeraceae archaeon]|jgi:uncharacterized protein YndB with AHSA1/START domain|nr:SRPBCC domain-containing protein [Nitrososphaeraceae archaeon]
MTTSSNAGEIRKSVVIDAPPDVVFKAISDDKELTDWFPDLAIFEPRVGGKVRFTFYKENSEEQDRDIYPEGEVLEFIPNQKISYTWERKDIEGFPRTIVTWQLEDIGNNKTRVELVHSGFAGAKNEMYNEHKEGWYYFLDKLVVHCNFKSQKMRQVNSSSQS